MIQPMNFNPRARVGRDGAVMQILPFLCHFNPRARVGRDASVAYSFSVFRYFNPRAHVGRDRRWGNTPR